MGGGDDPYVDLAVVVLADPADLALLDGAQQPYLQSRGGLADLVQEEGAPVCGFEQARPVAGRVGESAFFVAEEFAFEEMFGQGPAVDGDKGFVPARPLLVDVAGQDLLAGASLAAQKHGGVAVDHLFQQGVDRFHGPALADDPWELGAAFDLLAQRKVLLLQVGDPQHGADPGPQLGFVDGFGDVIVGPGVQAGDLVLGGGAGGQHDHRGGAPLGGDAHFFEDLDAVHAGHHPVQQHQVGPVLLEPFKGFGAAVGHAGLVPLLFELLFE